MKTFNTKLIVALITTLVLTGCMPDSLTKFKKDAPKKAASTAVDTTPPISDGNGNAVDPDTLEFPTKFYFGQEGVAVEEAFTVNTPIGSVATPKTDGTLADPATRSIIFIRCELDQSGAVITRTLPPGLTLDSSTCGITGTPTAVYSDAGAKIAYTVRMLYKGADYTGVGTESSITASLKLAVSTAPTGLDMTQNDKLQIKLTPKGGVLIADIKTNTDPLVSYNRYGLLNSNKNVAGVVKYVDSSSSTVGVYKVQPLVVTSTIPFSVNGFVSSASKSGKILSKSSATNTIYVESLTGSGFVAGEALDNVQTYVTTKATVAQPLVVGTTAPFTINGYVSSSGKYGRVSSISTTTNTIYVELVSGSAFAAGNALDNVQTYAASKTTVSSVISVDTANAAYKFPIAAKIDNDSQYFSERYTVEKVIQTYERGVAIQPISPILNSTLVPANGIVYGISPALPAGLSFSTTTGIISGTFTDTLDATDFTIGAYNDLGESFYTVTLAAINSPKDLSYTSNQLISVNSNTLFMEGESLFQPIAAPLTTSVQAKILRKVSTNKLSIETLNGNFLSEASLDSGNAYYSEKNYVTLASAPNHFNVALKVTSAVNFPAGTYVGASNGAKGRVIYADTVNNVLYVQFLTPTVVSSTPAGASVFSFTEGTTLDDTYPWAGAVDTIDQVEASNMALTLNDSTGFDSGNDFTTNTSLSGYIYDLDSSTDIIKVNEINRTSAVGSNYFRVGQSLDQGEYYLAPATTISAVTHDNLIVVERGVSRVLNANVSQGTSIIYSISPALPSGLALNALTGVISGTPTAMSARKTYVVTATNLLDKSFYTFDLEVRDYFTFTEASGAKSFLTHKVGDSRSNRGCRINTADILNGTSAGLDIGCNLEAEELELFYAKLKMTASVGGGACEYIGFRPYSFWQYSPKKSAKTIRYASSCSGGAGANDSTGAVTAAPTIADCDGNYMNVGGPNCDTGSITVTTYSASAGATCDTVSTSTIICGGVKTACLAGPVTTVMSSAELLSGYRSQTVASSTGATKTWELKSSVEYLDVTNLRNANGVVNNACQDTRAHANLWADQASTLPTVSPFGGESPYYEFTCLDAAKDIKARIRLSVREWNRTFRINDIYDLMASVPVPATFIPKKMDDASSPMFGTSYNNVMDWDDDYSGLGAAEFSSCAVIPVGTGVCADVAKLTESDCINAGEIWTSDAAADVLKFKYPGSDI